MRSVLLLLALCGCDRVFGLTHIDVDAGSGDAAGITDAADAMPVDYGALVLATGRSDTSGSARPAASPRSTRFAATYPARTSGP